MNQGRNRCHTHRISNHLWLDNLPYKPLFCIVGATALVRFALEKITWQIHCAALSILFHIAAVVLVYLVLLRLTRAVEKEDVRWVKKLFKIKKKVESS